jgi:uncharacterized protein YcbX
VSHAQPDDVAAYVSHLRTTPIKGFAMREQPRVLLAAKEGVAGDRAFFLMDGAGTLLSATRTARFLPYWASFDTDTDVLAIGRDAETLLEERVVSDEETEAHFFADRYASGEVVQGPWNRFLTEIAGQTVRLVRATGALGGFDVHPVSLLSGASVRALTDDDHEPLDGRRFRMTVTVEGVAAFGEDAWLGETWRIGDAVVRMTSPVRRCAAVQKDPRGVDRRVDALRRIAQVRGAAMTAHGRGLHLGVYGDVEQGGYVEVGDRVQRSQKISGP